MATRRDARRLRYLEGAVSALDEQNDKLLEALRRADTLADKAEQYLNTGRGDLDGALAAYKEWFVAPSGTSAPSMGEDVEHGGE